jgi:hypothetical protein
MYRLLYFLSPSNKLNMDLNNSDKQKIPVFKNFKFTVKVIDKISNRTNRSSLTLNYKFDRFVPGMHYNSNSTLSKHFIEIIFVTLSKNF